MLDQLLLAKLAAVEARYEELAPMLADPAVLGNRQQMQKLSKEQLYQAILYPNDAILMGYETWVVRTKKGETFESIAKKHGMTLGQLKEVNGISPRTKAAARLTENA